MLFDKIIRCGRNQVINFGTRRLTTNLWGAPETENIPLHQNCIFKGGIFDPSFGWKWNRPNPILLNPGDQWISPIYPSVHIGKDPWGGYQTTMRLPKKYSEIRSLIYDVNFEFTTMPTEEYNFDFDTWLTPTNFPDPNTLRKEVMVTMYDTSHPPEDKYRGDVSDGYHTFRYYEMNNDFSAFILKRPAIPGRQYFRVNMKKLLDFLISKKRLENSLYLCQIDLGNEAWKSSGEIKINRYTVYLDNMSI